MLVDLLFGGDSRVMSTSAQTKFDEPFVGVNYQSTATDVSLSEFLAPFYPDVHEEIRLRAFVARGAPEKPTRKFGITREALDCDPEVIEQTRQVNQDYGIYFTVNAGGDNDESINRINAFFVEIDDCPIDEQIERYKRSSLRPSILIKTRKSVHAYFLLKGECTKEEWADIQCRLIQFFQGDAANKNPSRVMRLPFFDHLYFNKETGETLRTPIELLDLAPERSYTLAEMRLAFPPVPERPKPEYKATERTGDGFSTWPDLLHELRQRIKAVAKRNSAGKYEMKCPVHNGNGDTSLFCTEDGPIACLAKPACSLADILLYFGLPAFPVNAKPSNTGDGGNGNTQKESGDSSDQPDEEFRCSDMGNGYRFARQHGQDVRYNKPSGKWFVWDDKRWAEDATDEAMRRAKETAKKIWLEAAYAPDEEKRKALGGHAKYSEKDANLRAMIRQAESELPVKLDVFDSNPLLFNCDSGVVDLHTGELRPHCREDMLTKLSPVPYNPASESPRWTAFLNKIFNEDQSLIKFIQKAVGYSLTGDVSEQCLFICHGTGANGKSVFLKTLAALTADYGQQVRTETLMIRKHQGVSNDIACLRGARFLSAVETDTEHRMAEATIKQLTGGDTVRARFLFHEEFEFPPQFKIWLAANHKPQVRGTDHAIWRRIKLIPFTVTIPKEEQNPKLDLELKEELPGILQWAVEGCLLWQKEGLGEPEAVRQATEDYREEMDVLSDFLSDRCAIGANYQVSPTEIYTAYEAWCTANGEAKQPQRWLASQLKERGFKQPRTKGGRFWSGIGLIRRDD